MDSSHSSSPPSPNPERSQSGGLPAGARLQRLLQVLSLPYLLFLIIPLLALFYRISLKELLSSLSQPTVIQAILLSLVTTVIATLIVIILGTPLALALARHWLPFERLIDTLIDLPLVLPPAVAGVALLMAFGRRGVIGGLLADLGINIAFTPVAVILAQVFIAAPFFIKAASLGFANVDRELVQAAGLDGASPWENFRYIVVPLSWTALLSGAVMTWARALGEFGATIIFAGNFPGQTQTMPLAIYIGFELDLQVALTLSAILVVISFLVLMAVKIFLHREVMFYN